MVDAGSPVARHSRRGGAGQGAAQGLRRDGNLLEPNGFQRNEQARRAPNLDPTPAGIAGSRENHARSWARIVDGFWLRGWVSGDSSGNRWGWVFVAAGGESAPQDSVPAKIYRDTRVAHRTGGDVTARGLRGGAPRLRWVHLSGDRGAQANPGAGGAASAHGRHGGPLERKRSRVRDGGCTVAGRLAAGASYEAARLARRGRGVHQAVARRST